MDSTVGAVRAALYSLQQGAPQRTACLDSLLFEGSVEAGDTEYAVNETLNSRSSFHGMILFTSLTNCDVKPELLPMSFIE